MRSQQELLAEANQRFPAFYEARKELNPDYIFQPGYQFPQVEDIIIHYENGVDTLALAKIQGRVKFLTKNQTCFETQFVCYADEDNAKCLILGKLSRNLKHFASEFIGFFFYEFLSLREISIKNFLKRRQLNFQ